MRSRKKILLVSESEDRLSILKFMLDTNGYAVTSALNATEAGEQLQAQYFELLLYVLPFAGIEHLLDQAREINPFMPSIVLVSGFTAAPDINVSAMLPSGCSSFELLERVKILTARKRGPRKKKPVISVPLMLAADRRLA